MFNFFQVAVTGDRICIKCDYAIVAFQGLQSSLRLKYSQLNVQAKSSAEVTKSNPASQMELKSNPNTQPIAETSGTLKGPYKRKTQEMQQYAIGQKIKFYNIETDDMAVGTIIKEMKPNVYKVGCNKKLVVLNADNFTPNN